MQDNMYNLSINFHSAKDLPNADMIGKSDPYLVVNFNGRSQFKSKVINDDLNPVWNECLNVVNITEGTNINIHVYDKDYITEDDLLGQHVYSFKPQGQSDGYSWKWEVDLPLTRRKHKSQGSVHIKFECRKVQGSGPLRLAGPVRWRRHTCTVTGLLTSSGSHFTYKLFLLNIPEVFDGKMQPWNRKYPAAQKIFDSRILGIQVGRNTINTQHQAMYNVDAKTEHGVCNKPEEFFALLDFGNRNGERRYYTYVLMEDSMRFSETGAALLKDITSKHAMHSSAAEEVYYAGEFCISPIENTGRFKLVIDNNSGTYAPDSAKLHLVEQLFTNNFPGMEVETLDYKKDEEKLLAYQRLCPSRALAQLAA